MCEFGSPNPPFHYLFDVLQFLYISWLIFFTFSRLIPLCRYLVVCCGHRVGMLSVVGVEGG